ncbi:MAG: 4Fe-4S binding protein, partial [Dehalococcoidia bacterium]|nr:4Fe-4S binding protein [Dehalococcoidia bacterium]
TPGSSARCFPSKSSRSASAAAPNSCTTPQVNDVGLVGILEPLLEADLCTGCELCVDACREEAITMVDGLPQREEDECLLCGDCVSVCPLDAWQTARVGYALYVGGKVGRHPQLGAKIAEFIIPEAVPRMVEKIVAFVQAHGNPSERFGVMLNRTGKSALVEYLDLGAACVANQR